MSEKTTDILFAAVIILFIIALFLLFSSAKRRRTSTPIKPSNKGTRPAYEKPTSMPAFNGAGAFTLIHPPTPNPAANPPQFSPTPQERTQAVINALAPLRHFIIAMQDNTLPAAPPTPPMRDDENPAEAGFGGDDTHTRDRQKESPEEFINNMIADNHDNDSQNVHNSYVNISLSRKYNRLYELHSEQAGEMQNMLEELGMDITELQETKIAMTMRELRDWAQENRNKTKLESRKFEVVLKEIEKGYSITSVSNAVDEDGNSIAIAEDWILTLAWERIHSPDNESVREQLIEALYDQLVDGAYCLRRKSLGEDLLRVFFGRLDEPGADDENPAEAGFDDDDDDDDDDDIIIKPVCINGRVGRILSSFTLIDTDSILSEPEKDDKEISNEAYTKASRVLNQFLENYADKISMSKQSLEDLYAKEDELLTASEQKLVLNFRESAKQEIAQTLKTDYENLIDEKLLFNITQQAISVV